MSLEYKKLGDVAKFIRGITYKPNDLVENFSENSTVCMRTANVQAKLKQDDLLSVPLSFVKNEEKFLIEGDLLVSTANSWNLVGKCCWVPKLDYSATAGGFISILRANQEKVDQHYLYHWFNSANTQLLARNCGRQTTNISNMDLGRCLDIKIPLPTLVEQRRIASILDKANELRQKRQQAIEKLDQLLQATFIDMFGDPKTNPYNFDIRKLSEFYINSKNGTKCGPFGSALKRHEYVENGIPVWSMDVITLGGAFIDKPSLWVTSEKFKELESYSVEQGDVIISRAGTVGKMGVVHSQHEKSLISTNLIRVRFGKMLLPEYFVALMTYCKHRLSRLQTGADGAFTHMSTGILDNLEFPYPPIEKQKQFVDFLHMVNNNKEILLKSDKRINELFSAVQNQAFSGTL